MGGGRAGTVLKYIHTIVLLFPVYPLDNGSMGNVGMFPTLKLYLRWMLALLLFWTVGPYYIHTTQHWHRCFHNISSFWDSGQKVDEMDFYSSLPLPHPLSSLPHLRYYLNSSCTKGDHCTFSHDITSKEDLVRAWQEV